MMQIEIRQTARAAGTVSETLVVVGVLAMAALAYGFSSGSGVGGQLASDRLVLARCWDAIGRQDRRPGGRDALVDACRRMERGFHRIYGSRP